MMKTGYLTMVEHPLAGMVPAIYVPAFCPEAGEEHNWPKPVHMWQPIFKDGHFLAWIKRPKHPYSGMRTGRMKSCEICGTDMYVTRSSENKRFCSQKCKNIQVGRDRLRGVVF